MNFFVYTLILLFANAATGGLPYSRSGTFQIGLVLPIHRANSSRTSDLDVDHACGQIDQEQVMQVIQFDEAVSFANDKLHLDVGFKVADSCSLPNIAINRVATWPSEGVDVVIGAADSAVTIKLASFFRNFNISMISFASTIVELTNKTGDFQLLSRTVASDVHQASAIASLARDFFKWSCVHFLSSSGIYGQSGAVQLRLALQNFDICRVTDIEIPSRANSVQFDSIVTNQLEKNGDTAAVICFCTKSDAVSLLKAIGRAQQQRGETEPKFYVVASDAFGFSTSDLANLDTVVNGSLAVVIPGNRSDEVREKFSNWVAKKIKKLDNPYLDELIEHNFGCSVKPSKVTKTCPAESLDSMSFPASSHFGLLQTSIEAVFEVLKLPNWKSEGFVESLRKIKFKDFKFSENGDGPAVYSIYSYMQRDFHPFARYHHGSLEDEPIANLEVFKRWTSDNKPIVSSCPKSKCLELDAIKELPCIPFYKAGIGMSLLILVILALIVVIVVNISRQRRIEAKHRLEREYQETVMDDAERQRLFGRGPVFSELTERLKTEI